MIIVVINIVFVWIIVIAIVFLMILFCFMTISTIQSFGLTYQKQSLFIHLLYSMTIARTYSSSLVTLSQLIVFIIISSIISSSTMLFLFDVICLLIVIIVKCTFFRTFISIYWLICHCSILLVIIFIDFVTYLLISCFISCTFIFIIVIKIMMISIMRVFSIERRFIISISLWQMMLICPILRIVQSLQLEFIFITLILITQFIMLTLLVSILYCCLIITLSPYSSCLSFTLISHYCFQTDSIL